MIVLLIGCLVSGTAPESRGPCASAYWIFLHDRSGRANAGESPTRLSRRAINRRALRRTAPGLTDDRDLPVHEPYVTAIRSTGAHIRTISRWLNAVSVEATPSQVRALQQLNFVRSVQPVRRGRLATPVPAAATPVPSPFEPRDGDPAWYGPSFDQLNQINVVAARNAGYTGQGVLIGILDTGFKRTHAAFNQTSSPAHPVRILGEHDYVSGDGNTAPEAGDAPGQYWHGTLILGTLAAYQPGVLVGSAYDATFLLAKTEDIAREVPAEEDNYVAALEWFEASGADVATSSLGYFDFDPPNPSYTIADLNGHTAVTTLAVNIATANGLACCTAAGNGGHDADPATLHLIAPADAYSVLTCGAVDAAGDIAGFSSDGPSYDGRIKPEILARGVSTVTIDPDNDTALTGASGTSLSTPLVAGGVALVVQAHPTWTVSQIRRALFHTAHDFASTGHADATFVRGYGVLDVMAAIQFVHGDINGDGIADGQDVSAFLSALSGANMDPSLQRRADINADGSVNAADVPLLVEDLLRP